MTPTDHETQHGAAEPAKNLGQDGQDTGRLGQDAHATGEGRQRSAPRPASPSHFSHPSPSSHLARPLRQAVACAAVVFAGCILVASGHVFSPDEEIMARLTEAITARGEVHIEPLLGFGTRSGRGGFQYPQYPPLQAVMATPIYGFARLTRPLVSDAAIYARVWGTTQNHDGSPDAYWNRFWLVLLFNPLVTAATAALVWLMALRLAGGDRRAAWATALAYGLATVALAHSRTFFTEPLAALWLMAALAALLRWSDHEKTLGRDAQATRNLGQDVQDAGSLGQDVQATGKARPGWVWALVAGVAGALGVWTRVDSPLFLPGIGIGVGLLAFPGLLCGGRIKWRALWNRRGWGAVAAYLAPPVLSLVAWTLFNRWRFGGVAATGYEDQPEGVQFATPFLVGLHGFLCTPGRGLFFFSPPLLVAICGLPRVMRGRTAFAWAFALSCGLFFVAMCKWQNWAGGWCWGPRHIVQLHAPLMLGLAPLLVAPRRFAVRWAYFVAFIVGFGVQMFGGSQSFIDYHHLFFRRPLREPNFTALYTPDEDQLIRMELDIRRAGASGDARVPAQYLPAPLNDSVYVPQHTVWYAYPVMLRDLHMHDFFWLHCLAPPPEP